MAIFSAYSRAAAKPQATSSPDPLSDEALRGLLKQIEDMEGDVGYA